MEKTWKIDGTYFEACNCIVACPCVFLSPPTDGECDALIAWHINKGSFGEIALDDLNAALVIHAPGNLIEGNWEAALYLDERADDPQREALGKILGGQAGGHPAHVAQLIGEVLGVTSAPIDYRAEGRKRSIRVGGYGEAAIEGITGDNDKEVTIENHPLAVAPGFPAVVAKSSHAHFDDHGLSWQVSDRNGFYSPFSYYGSGPA